jgi:hypothetical protein
MRRRFRRWTLAAGIAGLVLLALAIPLACTTTIVPPPAPDDAVAVFLIDYGMTSALVLPHDGALSAYAYGDWQYYALRNNHAGRGIAALVWPTQGALGRGRLQDPATANAILEQLRGRGAEELLEIHVAAAAVERLRQRLDAQYEEHQTTEVENADYGMSFVHHPQRYTWFWNSNHQTAAWLRELGCDVRGPAFASRWRVEGG